MTYQSLWPSPTVRKTIAGMAGDSASRGTNPTSNARSTAKRAEVGPDWPFRADDASAPHSPYAQSKLEAELALHEMPARTGLEVVVVRPPLVYGPDAPGNFSSLMRAVQRGVPLPLDAVSNQRRLVAVDNLVDLLALCTTHPAAAGEVFMVSDGEDEDVSATARRLPVPVELLRGVGQLLSKASTMQSLCASLQVDIESTRTRLGPGLGWSPSVSLNQALATAAWLYPTTLNQRQNTD